MVPHAHLRTVNRRCVQLPLAWAAATTWEPHVPHMATNSNNRGGSSSPSTNNSMLTIRNMLHMVMDRPRHKGMTMQLPNRPHNTMHPPMEVLVAQTEQHHSINMHNSHPIPRHIPHKDNSNNNNSKATNLVQVAQLPPQLLVDHGDNNMVIKPKKKKAMGDKSEHDLFLCLCGWYVRCLFLSFFLWLVVVRFPSIIE